MFSSTLFQSRRLSLEIQRHVVATKGAPLYCTGIDSLCPMLMQKGTQGILRMARHTSSTCSLILWLQSRICSGRAASSQSGSTACAQPTYGRCGRGCCAFRDHVNNCRHATTAVCKYIRWESDPRASKVVSVASTEIGMLVGYSARSSAAPVVVGTAFET